MAPSAPSAPPAPPAPGAWFDSHCHLQDQYLPGSEGATDPAAAGAGSSAPEPLGPGVRDALGRAVAAGVGQLVCVGTDLATSAQALALAGAVRELAPAGLVDPVGPVVWATVGLHPHDASAGTDGIATLLAATLARGDATLVGIGECGLDYHYEHSPRGAQRSAFAEQIQLARTHDLTLVVHARDAWDDLFDVLGAEGVPERAVLHCFTGGPAEARRCLDLGMYVSFSGIITFKNAAEVRAAAALCPPERLLVETDSPFLAPVPHRGRPNEPAFVPLVGEAVAAVRGVSAAEVARDSAEAARRAFVPAG